MDKEQQLAVSSEQDLAHPEPKEQQEAAAVGSSQEPGHTPAVVGVLSPTTTAEGKFYIIQLVNRDNQISWVHGLDEKGRCLVADKFTAESQLFYSYQEAKEFISKHKLARKGVRTSILDNAQLMVQEAGKEDGVMKTKVMSPNSNLFFICSTNPVTGKKEYAHIDKTKPNNDKSVSYKFREQRVGACMYTNPDDILKVFKDNQSANDKRMFFKEKL